MKNDSTRISKLLRGDHPRAAAVKLAEALVGLGLRTSKQGDYAKPAIKNYTGVMAEFVPGA